MELIDKQTSIRTNAIYCEMLNTFEIMSDTFNSTAADLERTDKAAFDFLDAAYFAALHAVDAVIDAHTAARVYEAVHQHQQTSVPIAALAGLYQNEAFQQSLTAYREAWNALAAADDRRAGREEMEPLDAACETAERGVVAAVQAFAANVAAQSAGKEKPEMKGGEARQ